MTKWSLFQKCKAYLILKEKISYHKTNKENMYYLLKLLIKFNLLSNFQKTSDIGKLSQPDDKNIANIILINFQ